MPNQYGDAAYWLNAAANARVTALAIEDEAARNAMLEVACQLETIARRAHDLENRQRKAS